MPVVDLECAKCQRIDAEMVPFLSERPPCPICGGVRAKTLSRPIVKIPAWMTDGGISSNARHREWLKSPEAKAMDLTRSQDDE